MIKSLMSKIIIWVKSNKLAAILLIIVGCFFWRSFRPPVYRTLPMTGGGEGLVKMDTLPMREAAPAPEVTERLVVKESSLSLLVRKVTETQKAIGQKAQEFGGYMVTSYISHPEESTAASGSITVRIPQAKFEEVLDYFRSLAVKVVSENLSGQDVTDEYVDIEARLAPLLKTKVKFEEILTQATKVEEILQVQRELINLQGQIDNLKGQQNYLEKSAQMSRIAVYLATDELELPYAPSQAWRPKAIFKQATRSLVASGRKLGSAVIWLAVYSVIWVPVLVIYLLIRRRRRAS